MGQFLRKYFYNNNTRVHAQTTSSANHISRPMGANNAAIKINNRRMYLIDKRICATKKNLDKHALKLKEWRTAPNGAYNFIRTKFSEKDQLERQVSQLEVTNNIKPFLDQIEIETQVKQVINSLLQQIDPLPPLSPEKIRSMESTPALEKFLDQLKTYGTLTGKIIMLTREINNIIEWNSYYQQKKTLYRDDLKCLRRERKILLQKNQMLRR